MRLRSWGALGAFAVLAALMLSVSAASGADGASKQLYIVQMLDKPVAAYEGGTAGIPATKPAKGKKINDEDPNVDQVRGLPRRQAFGSRQEGRREARCTTTASRTTASRPS